MIAVDAPYLASPHVTHVTRQAFLLRLTPECWEDACWACTHPGCACACHDTADLPLARCKACRYQFGTTGHLVICDPQWLAARITALADEIGALR